MIWTAEMDAVITASRGVSSAAQIAAIIGRGLTRSAVLGRVNRLGLPKIKHAVCGGGPHRARRVNGEKKIRTAPVREFASPPVPVAPLNIPFVDLERRHCREIVGSEGFGMPLSCGHPVIDGSSYCRWHHSINYTSRQERLAA